MSTLPPNPDGHAAESDVAADDTVGQLLVRVEPARPETPCGHVYDRLFLDRRIHALPVVTGVGQPVGLVRREQFMRAYERRNATEWPASRPIAEYLRHPPLVVDEETTLDAVAELVVEEGGTHILDGVAITRNGVYAGTATGYALVRALVHRRQHQRHHAASHDEVTGLANRGLFEDHLAFALASADRSRARVGVLHVELERLPASPGDRSAMDGIAQQVAGRLRAAVRKGDTVARLGATSFGIVLPSLPHAEAAQTVARKIVEALDAPLDPAGDPVNPGCSVGLSLSPDDGTAVARLMRGAEGAAAHARQMRYAYLWCGSDRDGNADEGVCSYASLREAIEQRQLALVYQPQVDLVTGRICGVEALVRWPQAGGASVPANEIIAVAEHSGLMVPLAEWVLTTACQQMRAWHEAGALVVRVAVNVSGVQLRQHALPAIVERTLKETGLPPAALEVELSERVLLDASPATTSALQALATLGVRVSMDDFGLSPLSVPQLARLPIDSIKLDRALVSPLGTDERAAVASAAVIAMAHTLRLEVIAEGVETAEQLHTLRAQRCDVMQGFYFSRPVGPSAVAQLIRDGRQLEA
jgi:diguanylate cyclase (GGDEF)-like protein